MAAGLPGERPRQERLPPRVESGRVCCSCGQREYQQVPLKLSPAERRPRRARSRDGPALRWREAPDGPIGCMGSQEVIAVYHF